RHGKRRRHRAPAAVVSAPRARAHARARGAPFRRRDHRRRGAVRAAQLGRAQFPAARCVRRWRHAVTQDRRTGQGVLHGVAAPRARRTGRRGAAARAAGRLRVNRIRVAAAEAIGRITLARPEKKNALDRVAADELLEALARYAMDPSVRVVLLAADGPDFCAGADLAALAALVDADATAQHDDAMALGKVFLAIRELPVPVVAAVRGRALAGGAGLATACDIVLADEDARFGYPEVKVGFVPAMVITMLRRTVGEKQAFDLVATGRVLSAREAHGVGLVSRVVPAGTLDAAADEMVRAVAASPPGAMAFTKRLFYALDGVTFGDGIALGARVNVDARDTAEFRDGVRRFLDAKAKGREGRTP